MEDSKLLNLIDTFERAGPKKGTKTGLGRSSGLRTGHHLVEEDETKPALYRHFVKSGEAISKAPSTYLSFIDEADKKREAKKAKKQKEAEEREKSKLKEYKAARKLTAEDGSRKRPRVVVAGPTNMNVFNVKLQSGEDLIETLNSFVEEHNFESGMILSCVGTLKTMKLKGKEAQTGSFSVLSLRGLLSKQFTSLQLSIGDEEGDVNGGIPEVGCTVMNTMELILGRQILMVAKPNEENLLTFEELEEKPVELEIQPINYAKPSRPHRGGFNGKRKRRF
eukprot:TRINITY_DN774142_c0_g1_i1.p1 TRINITY_DN774142_c0_g1~~TRINITY_DN774142_c0_g1_i1.p1  ORF type:complete len:279 (-),score=91.82 TRINITY_DN774142_c0_g1_i1:200-1036(-)